MVYDLAPFRVETAGSRNLRLPFACLIEVAHRAD